VARTEAVVAVTGESGVNSTGELSVVLHPRPDNTAVTSDLATIVESLALNTDCPSATSANGNSNRTSNSSKPLFSAVRGGNKVPTMPLKHFTVKVTKLIEKPWIEGTVTLIICAVQAN
jgi:hypothetical protein